LRPELNRIRGWVRQGRTDAWIAHQLEVTVQQIQAFKREQSLEPGSDGEAVDTAAAADFDDEIDLRAEDDALIAAELDAEAEAKAAAEQEAAEKAAAEAAEKAAARAARIAAGEDDEDDEEEEADADDDKPKRRRGRRGGRSASRRKKPVGPLEGTFDHGEEGYGLWLDPSVQDDPVYAEHWAGHRPVEVSIEEDQIVIRRVVADVDADGADDDIEEPSAAETVSED
jgi:hypothetical protein